MTRMTGDNDVSVGHLQRRKIEGRVLIPFIAACRAKFGDDETRNIVGETIRQLAAEDGARWAETYGSDLAGLKRVAEDLWAGGGSMAVEVVSETEQHLDFNITRCRYAEFYQDLGLADLGYQVHCNRDYAMIVGFNPDLALTRTQTIMEGAAHCDFRFREKQPE
jgi:hypothetical protein